MREFGPVYGISQRKRSAAAECSTGTETFEMTEAIMTASLSVQFPLYALSREFFSRMIPDIKGKEYP